MAVAQKGSARKGGRRAAPRMTLLLLLVVLALLAYFYFGRNLKVYRVISNSMNPILNQDDRVLAMSQGDYERGDIVVLRDPLQPSDFLVKRLIAKEGDTVRIDGGALYLNGEYVSEPYVAEPMDYALGGIDVEEGELFLLGDNRNESTDSASVRWPEGRGGEPWPAPTVSESELMGKVLYRIAPAESRGVVRHYPLRPVETPLRADANTN